MVASSFFPFAIPTVVSTPVTALVVLVGVLVLAVVLVGFLLSAFFFCCFFMAAVGDTFFADTAAFFLATDSVFYFCRSGALITTWCLGGHRA